MFRPVLFTVLLWLAISVMPAQTSFYDISKIQKIEVFFESQQWDHMLDTARSGSDSYVRANLVRINGRSFNDVGIKYKGNSSYDSTFKKNPVHIELDAFKYQAYDGVTDIKLSNGYADPSMVREVLAYQILGNYMPCSRSNFAQLYINNNYIGLFSNSEAVNTEFCRKNFYSGSGTFIKANPKLTPSPNVKSNLRYLTADSSSYFNYYELKTECGWNDVKTLCDSITNHPSNLQSVLNMDRVTWMLAFNLVTVNLDSYSGAFAQNYYLYKDLNGKFNPIVWDLNMSFGGFPFLGNSNSSLASLSISSMQNMPLSIHANDSYWPLIKAVNSTPLYKKMFLAHVKTLLQEQFSNGAYLEKYKTLHNLVDTATQSDNKKFFSYQQFQNALTANTSIGTYSVPGLQTLMEARQVYLGSTSELSSNSPTIVSSRIEPTSSQQVRVNINVNGADTVHLFYRYTVASAFSVVTLTSASEYTPPEGKEFSASLNLKGDYLQYYFFAEGMSNGIFSPQRAAREYYSFDRSYYIKTTAKSFQVYPSPANQQLSITTANGSVKHVQLINTSGRMVVEADMTDNMSLNLDAVANGIYVLKVDSDFQKIIISH